jgi:phage terminase large subunit-like protein
MSYFRLPIDKLLEKLPRPVEFNESQQAMIDGLNEHRFFVHIAGRRTGKSYGAAILAFAKLLEPGQQVMVVAPNFSLSSIIWDYVTDLIRQMDIEVEKFNQKDKVVKLINGSIFRLLSANNRDSLVGRAANLLIVDEAAIIPNDEYFTRDLRPALSTFKDSRCLWISTPRGKGNYLYD